MGFDPYNCFLKIQESIGALIAKMGSLGSVTVHSLTLSCTPKSMKCDSQASLLAHTFINPCLGCKPKAKVATIVLIIKSTLFYHKLFMALEGYFAK